MQILQLLINLLSSTNALYLLTKDVVSPLLAVIFRYAANDSFQVVLYDSQGQFNSYGYEGGDCDNVSLEYQGRKASIFVVINKSESTITVNSTLYTDCCYDCRKRQEPPATILYPKVDIENFAVAGGATIINDGKLLTNLSLSPGVQQTFIQIENRGFFTQNDTRIRFEGSA